MLSWTGNSSCFTQPECSSSSSQQFATDPSHELVIIQTRTYTVKLYDPIVILPSIHKSTNLCLTLRFSNLVVHKFVFLQNAPLTWTLSQPSKKEYLISYFEARLPERQILRNALFGVSKQLLFFAFLRFLNTRLFSHLYNPWRSFIQNSNCQVPDFSLEIYLNISGKDLGIELWICK